MVNISRRRLLQGVGATLALRGFHASAAAPVYFTHGVASGDPLADRVIIWSRALPTTAGNLECEWQISSKPDFQSLAASGKVIARPTSDYTLKVDVTGLKPGQTYFYRFRYQDIVSPIGRTKTLPIGAVSSFKLGVASCSNYPQGYFHAYRHMAESNLDLVLHLGDYIYEYAEGRYANKVALEKLNRHVEPTHEIVSLEDYRQRYGLYRSDKDLQLVHQQHPFVCVWDDHELTNNTWREGAENHNDGEGDFFTRMANARRAFHEWMPIRTRASTQEPIFRRFAIGDLADLVMLDTRLHGRQRGFTYQQDLGDQPTAEQIRAFKRQLNAPERTLLGKDQEQWLTEQLATSKQRNATWQVIGQQVLMGKLGMPVLKPEDFSGVPLTPRRQRFLDNAKRLNAEALPFNLDAWDGYPACRQRVIERLQRNANNPVVLAGDTHNAWAFNLQDENHKPAGIELGTPGITSPGLESFLPGNPQALKAALKASSPELKTLDTESRGWTELELTHTASHARWHFVDNVLSKRYSITTSDTLTCQVGARAFS